MPWSDYQGMYNQRPQIECTNCMIKMHTGAHILARNERSKMNAGPVALLA